MLTNEYCELCKGYFLTVSFYASKISEHYATAMPMCSLLTFYDLSLHLPLSRGQREKFHSCSMIFVLAHRKGSHFCCIDWLWIYGQFMCPKMDLIESLDKQVTPLTYNIRIRYLFIYLVVDSFQPMREIFFSFMFCFIFRRSIHAAS